MLRGGLDIFRPGARVYLPGGTGELVSLAMALGDEPERMADVVIESCLIPGINRIDYAALNPRAEMRLFLLPPQLRASFEANRVKLLPLPYSRIAAHFARGGFDAALAHVSPPDADGRCSLGMCADFTPIVWPTARERILMVNQRMPRVCHGPTLSISEATLVVETDDPVLEVDDVEFDVAAAEIASHIARLVPNGATIQFGIGGAPRAGIAALRHHRDLRIASGMITTEVIDLLDAGALSRDRRHLTGMAVGSSSLYARVSEEPLFELASVNRTHAVAELATLPAFHAINSALEIDLMGQANLEWRAGLLMSGVGGAPDFARAGAISNGGRSIIALPATAKRGTVSRIVARLQSPSVSLARSDIDVVITEFGVAELRDKPIDERAEALIAVAAPARRAALADEWRRMRPTM